MPGNAKNIILLLLFSLGAVTTKAQEVNFRVPFTRPISVENMTKELLRQGVAHWIVVLAQSITEAGWQYDSYLFRHTNNFIGMRVPGNRPSMRTDRFRGYSQYARWEDCVKDVKIWQDHFWQGGSQLAYINRMHNVWAQSPLYRIVLLSIIDRLEQMITSYVEHQRNHFNFVIIRAYLHYYQLQRKSVFP